MIALKKVTAGFCFALIVAAACLLLTIQPASVFALDEGSTGAQQESAVVEGGAEGTAEQEGALPGAEGEGSEGAEDPIATPVPPNDKPSSLSSTMHVEEGSLDLVWGAAQTPGVTYEVCWRVAGAEEWNTTTTTELSYTIADLEENAPYEVRVYVQGGEYRSIFRLTATTTVATNLNNSHAVKVTAESVADASGYDFTIQRYGESWKMVDAGESTSMSFLLEQGAMAGFKVRPYVIFDDVKYEGAWSAGDYRYCETVGLSTALSYASRKLVVTSHTAEAPVGVMNYRIVHRQGTSGNWSAQLSESNVRTVVGLSSGKEQQVGVAPVVKVSGRAYIGAYTYAYRYCVSTAITKASIGGAERTVSWNENTGASGYQLIYSTDPSFGSYATLTIHGASSTSTKVANLKADGTYFFKVRAFKTVSEKTHFGPWSAVKASSDSLEGVMTAKAQSYDSKTKWLILVDCTNNKTAVFTGEQGSWELHRFMNCSTGAPATPTVKGTFTIGYRGLHFGEDEGYTCWYWTQFYGDYLFHSVLYYPYSKTAIQDGRLGQNLSHGCVRLNINDAKWIYDNISKNSKVVVYS